MGLHKHCEVLMAVKGPGAQYLALVGLGAIVAVGMLAKMVFDAGSLSAGLQVAAFFLGAGGMMLMFFRWRLHGDARARALVLVAFAGWVLAIGVASVTDSGTRLGGPGSWLAGLLSWSVSRVGSSPFGVCTAVGRRMILLTRLLRLWATATEGCSGAPS
jgi:hypothetical protein